MLGFESHLIACNETARCVLWAHRLRLFPPPPTSLTRLRLDGSCSARRTAASASKGKSAAQKQGQPRQATPKKRPQPVDAVSQSWFGLSIRTLNCHALSTCFGETASVKITFRRKGWRSYSIVLKNAPNLLRHSMS